MLRDLKIRVALWLLSGLTLRERDELLSAPRQEPVCINVSGLPIWFVDAQRIDVSEFPKGIGEIVEVKTGGRTVGECFAVIGIPDHLGEANAQLS